MLSRARKDSGEEVLYLVDVYSIDVNQERQVGRVCIDSIHTRPTCRSVFFGSMLFGGHLRIMKAMRRIMEVSNNVEYSIGFLGVPCVGREEECASTEMRLKFRSCRGLELFDYVRP